MGFWEWLHEFLWGRPVGPTRPTADTSRSTAQPQSWEDLERRVTAAVQAGRRDVAINLYRNFTGSSQGEAEEGVNDIVARRGSAPAAAAPSASPAAALEKPDIKPLPDLNPGAFAPLSHNEVRQGAQSIGSLWGNPWFGRRDIIPPTSDPRTALIDRAMVGQGLITPEELEEIHRVGAEMDEIRPDLAVARGQAEAAVQRDQQAREELKKQKKAEAAERRRKRAEEIAHRRATDIIYLGRGVSAGLADRRANVEKLNERELPVLASPANVAKALGMTIPKLRWLAYHSEATARIHYVSFTVPKKSGGVRYLSAPHRDLAAAQEWILKNILEKITPHEAAHGFVRGRSTVTGAAEHVGTDVLLNADLEDFFPTITFPRVRGLFKQLGYSPAAATILALLCTEAPRRRVDYDGKPFYVATGPRCLPQGACTSPAISNLVSRRLDARLAGIADKLGWNYTRYADDLTFSASGEAAEKLAYLLARIRHISEDEGFRVNESKTRVLRNSAQQQVTGVVVNERCGAPRKLVRRLRAILHQAKRTGLAAQNRDDHPHFEQWVRGMIAYVAMLNPQQAEPLQQALAEIARS